jgi:DNA-binding NarL/FixJ family response regulator
MIKGKRILIVEDEKVVAEATAEFLKGAGYDIIGIPQDGEKAVGIALSTRPDLIIMDIRLKGEMDGIEAVEEIHGVMYVPVVYLTAYSEPATIERANRTRHSGFIKKPVMEEDLEITVAAVLRKEGEAVQ